MKPNEQLLMIDDDQLVLQTFKLWLEDEGYVLHTTSNRIEALAILREHPIAVALVDLRIEGENGLEIAKELCRIESLLKIIIITGYPSYETAIDAMRLGIYDYASKASDSRDILKKIEDALETRRHEINSISKDIGDKTGFILVCHHVMIKEGFENFCREYPEYCMTHNYHSLDYIKPGDFNSNAALVLICSACNHMLTDQPDETMRPLKILLPRAALVMINNNQEDDVKKKMVRLGIKGFLPKNITKENMKKSFRTILKGQIWVSRKIAHELLNELLDYDTEHQYQEPQNPYNLSNREIEILQAIASGLSNSEISNKLFISEKTVKAHINHLFKKMEVKSRTQAVKKAVEDHII